MALSNGKTLGTSVIKGIKAAQKIKAEKAALVEVPAEDTNEAAALVEGPVEDAEEAGVLVEGKVLKGIATGVKNVLTGVKKAGAGLKKGVTALSNGKTLGTAVIKGIKATRKAKAALVEGPAEDK